MKYNIFINKKYGKYIIPNFFKRIEINDKKGYIKYLKLNYKLKEITNIYGNNIENIEFNDNLINIKENSFCNTKVSELCFNKNLKLINSNCFNNCTNLKSITFNSFPNVYNSFNNCVNLNKITFNIFSKSVTLNLTDGYELLSINSSNSKAGYLNFDYVIVVEQINQNGTDKIITYIDNNLNIIEERCLFNIENSNLINNNKLVVPNYYEKAKFTVLSSSEIKNIDLPNGITNISLNINRNIDNLSLPMLDDNIDINIKANNINIDTIEIKNNNLENLKINIDKKYKVNSIINNNDVGVYIIGCFNIDTKKNNTIIITKNNEVITTNKYIYTNSNLFSAINNFRVNKTNKNLEKKLNNNINKIKEIENLIKRNKELEKKYNLLLEKNIDEYEKNKQLEEIYINLLNPSKVKKKLK